MYKVNHVEKVSVFGNRVQIHYEEITFDKVKDQECIVPTNVRQMLLELKFDNGSDASHAHDFLYYLKDLNIEEMKLC